VYLLHLFKELEAIFEQYLRIWGTTVYLWCMRSYCLWAIYSNIMQLQSAWHHLTNKNVLCYDMLIVPNTTINKWTHYAGTQPMFL